MSAQTVLPDEILEEIFLRLDAAADLVRASAACSSFRRIVSEPRFHRRFRSLRSPAILGFISRDSEDFFPVDPPHRCAPEARALDQAADFTFSFVPDPSTWGLCHAWDGRVLLSRRISTKIWFDDFLVCDPLYRRHVKIPSIPDDLMASAPPGSLHLIPVLAPAGENDEEDKSFRVIVAMQLPLKDKKVMAFVFSSCDQKWRGIVSTVHLPNGCKFTEPKSDYAHGCLYWMFSLMGYSLVLDISEMEFFVIDLPPHNFDSERAIVEAEEGGLRLLTIADGTIVLYCKNWQSNGVWAQELQHDKLIQLPKDSGKNYTWITVGTVGHWIALEGSRQTSHEVQKSDYFVLDTKTLLLEKVCALIDTELHCIPCARFPPPFALPSI